MSMKISVGPPVSGQNFFPRPDLMGRVARRLESNHLAFVGPRRTGKTSCLTALHASPPTGFEAIQLDLEQFDTAAAWLKAMVAGIQAATNKPQSKLAQARNHVEQFLGRIEKLDVGGLGKMDLKTAEAKHPWRPAADEFRKLLREMDTPLLFLLDEFPTFLELVLKKNSREEVEALLNWFRSVRIELSGHRVRFLVTGSIGLKGLVRRLGLSPTINDFDTLEIEPLSDKQALDFLERLAAASQIHLTVKSRRLILELLGANWPILLQLFVSEILEANLPPRPKEADLRDLYANRLVSGSRNAYCDSMHSRLPVVFSPGECRLARAILKELCLKKALAREDFDMVHARLLPAASSQPSDAEELEHVLDTLKHDGYLLQETTGTQHTRFASNILRDYWSRKVA